MAAIAVAAVVICIAVLPRSSASRTLGDVDDIRKDIIASPSLRQKFEAANRVISIGDTSSLIEALRQQEQITQEDQLLAICIGRSGDKRILPVLQKIDKENSELSSFVKAAIQSLDP